MSFLFLRTRQYYGRRIFNEDKKSVCFLMSNCSRDCFPFNDCLLSLHRKLINFPDNKTNICSWAEKYLDDVEWQVNSFVDDKLCCWTKRRKRRRVELKLSFTNGISK